MVVIIMVNMVLSVKTILFGEIGDFFGYIPMVVLSDSMQPTLQRGDLIVCKKGNIEKIQVGDVVSFYAVDNSSQVVTHRVVSKGQDEEGIYYYTQGDANSGRDQNRVYQDRIVGIYGGWRVAYLGHFFVYLQSPSGLYLFVLLPLFVCIALLMWECYRKDKIILLKEEKRLKNE